MSTPATNASKIDQLSQDGFGKGKSELYDAARPRYNPQIFSHIRSLVNKESGINVVEIGCGSGIFTRSLLTHPDWSGCLATLHAIDPNEGMRNVFASTVNDPRVTLTDGTFDNTGVESGTADVIMMASAFHWCLDFEAAINESVRILRPNGVVVIVTYTSDRNSDIPYVQQLRELLESYDERVKNTTRTGRHHELWRDAFDAPSYPNYFDPPHEESLVTVVETTIEKAVMLLMTISYIAILPEEQKKIFGDRFREIMYNGKSVEWIDKEQGTLYVPQRTLAVSMRRKDL